ncbi:sporulation protein YunB, partial [Eubacteriales bacterium DFI.9.88]|nr:sporulation protein YunB [Eubacteriales bacterium DFI.9.88]
EFEAKGINQTKYKVYIILKSQVKVLAPLSASTFDMSSTVLIAEAVILGGVPKSYVQVPKEDILDVTDD